MGVLVPSILVSSRKELERELALLHGLVDTVQIDVVDGTFASPPTWPYANPQEDVRTLGAGGQTLHQWGHFKYEIDLMIEHPETALGDWITFGAQRLLIHVGDTEALAQMLQTLEERFGHDKGFAPDLLSVGLALHMDTNPSVIEPYLEEVDYVQFMGIDRVGRQGVLFDAKVIERMHAFHKAHPDMAIQVDGGVSLENAPALLAAGADHLIVGSALWRSTDLAETVKHFDRLGESYGLYR